MVGNNTSGDEISCVMDMTDVDVPTSVAAVPLNEFVSVIFPPETAPAARTIEDLAPMIVAEIAEEYARLVPAMSV